jgi:hypothetical protein
MIWDIDHIFMYPPISGTTINNVFLSPEFRIIIYCVIVAILFFGTLYLIFKKYSFRKAFQKAVVAAFFTSGIIYAVHADIGWATWVINDSKNYWGLSTEKKLETLDGDFYRFARQAKEIISSDYELFTSDEYAYFRIQYYLLPSIKRDMAPHIVVILDKETKYDPKERTLRSGTRTISNLKPVLIFANNAYLLKRE